MNASASANDAFQIKIYCFAFESDFSGEKNEMRLHLPHMKHWLNESYIVKEHDIASGAEVCERNKEKWQSKRVRKNEKKTQQKYDSMQC